MIHTSLCTSKYTYVDGEFVQYILCQSSKGCGCSYGKLVSLSSLALHVDITIIFLSYSDKLSLFMESKGASSPGILTLTSSLSQVCVHNMYMCNHRLQYSMYVAISMVVEMFKIYGSKKDLKGKSQQNGWISTESPDSPECKYSTHQ